MKDDFGDRRILEKDAPLKILLYASSSVLSDLNILEKLPRLSASLMPLSLLITGSISISVLSTEYAEITEFEMVTARKRQATSPTSEIYKLRTLLVL